MDGGCVGKFLSCEEALNAALLCSQGVWKPRKIPNPAFFEDLQPFRMTSFSALGLELWSMTSDIFFDNFFITDDRNAAERWAADGWGLKKAAEGAAEVSTGWAWLRYGRSATQGDFLQPVVVLPEALFVFDVCLLMFLFGSSPVWLLRC